MGFYFFYSYIMRSFHVFFFNLIHKITESGLWNSYRFFILCVRVLPACPYVHHMHAWRQSAAYALRKQGAMNAGTLFFSCYVQSLVSAREVGGTSKASLSLLFWKHTHQHTQNCISMMILNLIKLTIKINHQNTVYIKLQVKSFSRSV